jgi:hypothetical protein
LPRILKRVLVQLALWAETSETTIKRPYRQVLTPEVGETWFKIGIKFNPK